MKKDKKLWLVGAMLLLITIPLPLWTTGSAHAQITAYTDEAAYLNALATLAYFTYQEDFEDDVKWGSARIPNTASSISSRGIKWTSNHPDAVKEPSRITTGNGPERTGMWGFFSYPHGNPDAYGSAEQCDIDNPPLHCFKEDGFIGTREPGAGNLYGAGGWVKGILGGKIILILDGDELNPIGFGGLGAVTNTYKFFGVIDTRGFTKFEFREIEGKIGDEKFIFADDFTFGVLSCGDRDGDIYKDEMCGGDDCNDADPNIHPGAVEICDGKDNDCDGAIDEILTRDTTCGVGACSGNTGYEVCIAGIWGNDTCDPLAGATTEVCDNLDNDCDGNVDEEGAQDCTVYYKDEDRDRQGAGGDSRCLCSPDELGKYTAIYFGDTDDMDPNIQGTHLTGDIKHHAGWRMVSLPLRRQGILVSDVFPGAKVVYGYEKGTGYVRVKDGEGLEVGKGYWILLNKAESFTLTGQTIHDHTFSINQDGWYMIGGCTFEAQVSGDKCNIALILRYVPGIGYQQVLESENLEPGKGYWVLFKDVIAPCNITIKLLR